MCFTFLAAQGHGVGSSLLETDMVDTCKRLLADAGDKLMLPTDVVVADAFSADAATRTVPITGIEDGWMGLDVGPETVAAFGRRSGRRARCFGTAPWACSRWHRSPRAPEVLRRRSPNRTRSASSAAAKLGRGRASARAARGRFLAHLHRRRGLLEYLEGKDLPGVAVLSEEQ